VPVVESRPGVEAQGEPLGVLPAGTLLHSFEIV